MYRTLLYLFLLFQPILLRAQQLIPFRAGGKWGYSDPAGKMLIPPQYDLAEPFTAGFAHVIQGKQMALINERNEQVIPMNDQLIGDVFLGTCIKWVSKGEVTKAGVVDVKNNTLIPFDYDYISREGNFYMVKSGQLYGIYDLKGKQVLPPDYRFIDQKDGFFYVSRDSGMGLFSLEGKPVTPVKYIVISNFSEGLAKVREGNKFGYINRQGKVVIPVDFDMGYSFSHHYAVVMRQGQSGKYGVIDRNGQVVIPFVFEQMKSFHDGAASARRDGKWGLTDTTGRDITPFEFDQIQRAYEGATACRKNNKWALYSAGGNQLTGFIYDSVSIIENDEDRVNDFGLKPYRYDPDYILVEANHHWGVCTKQGKEIIPPVYADIYPFTKGVALVKQNGKWGMFDSTGKSLTPFKYDRFTPYISSHDSWKESGVMSYEINRKAGLINATGKEITTAMYDYIIPDDNGYFRILIDKKSGVLDTKGSVVITPKYDAIRVQRIEQTKKESVVVDGLILVQMNGKPGYVGRDGKEFFRD